MVRLGGCFYYYFLPIKEVNMSYAEAAVVRETVEQIESAPSIGAIGEVIYDERNDRYKGLLPVRVDEPGGLVSLSQEVLGGVDLSIGSRFTLRCFGSPQLRQFSRAHLPKVEIGPFRPRVEAAIPIRDGGRLVYLGSNRPSRMPLADVLADERTLTDATARPSGAKRIRPLPSGYQVEIAPQGTVGTLKEEDFVRIVEIYTIYDTYTTPLNLETVPGMLEDGLAGFVRNENNKVVSVTIGEVARVNGYSLCEVSDSATHRDFLRGGLNMHAKRAVLTELVRQDVDIIYAEARANSAPVQIGNFRVGMEVCGELIRHCQISSSAVVDVPDPTDEGFGSLLVYYLTEDSRRAYAQNPYWPVTTTS
ncbi:hypothetical protein ACFLZP_01610 [Patescibacteria group bacterium]